MISSPVKLQFELVLREQHIADNLAALTKATYFDETPLYSRYTQVDFLGQFGDKNLLLIDLALDFLDRVCAGAAAESIDRFAAITVISDDDGKHLVPQLFLCNGETERRLGELELCEPTSNLGRQVADLVTKAKPNGEFDVSEDLVTAPGQTRVFISRRSPPLGFIAASRFR